MRRLPKLCPIKNWILSWRNRKIMTDGLRQTIYCRLLSAYIQYDVAKPHCMVSPMNNSVTVTSYTHAPHPLQIKRSVTHGRSHGRCPSFPIPMFLHAAAINRMGFITISDAICFQTNKSSVPSSWWTTNCAWFSICRLFEIKSNTSDRRSHPLLSVRRMVEKNLETIPYSRHVSGLSSQFQAKRDCFSQMTNKCSDVLAYRFAVA